MKSSPLAVCILVAAQMLAAHHLFAQSPAPSPANGQVIADAQTDFSDKQGKANWSYLYFISSKDGTILYVPEDTRQMKWQPGKDDEKSMWQGPEKWLRLTENGSHPLEINHCFQGWTVRRWTSDRDGTIHIVSHVDRAEKEGDGTGIKVFVDGKPLFEKLLTPASSVDIDLSPVVKKGSFVDFVVTPGPALDPNNDSVNFKITILRPADGK